MPLKSAHGIGTSLGLGGLQCGPLLESLPTDASFNAALILTHLRGESGVDAPPLLEIWEMKFCMSSSHEFKSKLFVLDGWHPVTNCCNCVDVWPLHCCSEWSLFVGSWNGDCISDMTTSVDDKLWTGKPLCDPSESATPWPTRMLFGITAGGPKNVLSEFGICNWVILGLGNKVPLLGSYGRTLFIVCSCLNSI